MLHTSDNITRSQRELGTDSDLNELEALYKESTIKPTGFYLHAIPVPLASKTDSGLYIPDKIQDDMNTLMTVAKVVSMGPECYDKKKENWCNLGDFVVFHKHRGSRVEINGMVVIMLTDDEVIATIEDPRMISKDYIVNLKK